jgi:hypothetical protein
MRSTGTRSTRLLALKKRRCTLTFPKGLKQRALDEKDKKTLKSVAKTTPQDTLKEAAFRGRRIDKLASILEDQYKQAEWAFEDIFTQLNTSFKYANKTTTAEVFEKDALALHGDTLGVTLLNMVKQSQGLPVLEMDEAAVKTAALLDRHLVDDTEPNRLFARLVKTAQEATRLQQGASYARAQCV